MGIRTAKEIIVGADSKAIRGGDKSKPEIVCKIQQVGTAFHAAANVTEDPETNFNVLAIVKDVFQMKASILEKADRFTSLVVPPLTRFLENIKRNHPETYHQEFQGKHTLDVVFFGMESDVPVVHLRSFVASDIGPFAVSVAIMKKNCPGDCETDLYFSLGHHDAIDTFLKENPFFWQRTTIIEGIRFLVTIEATMNPDDVGLPIDLIHLSKDGVEWIQKKNQCLDIQTDREPKRNLPMR